MNDGIMLSATFEIIKRIPSLLSERGIPFNEVAPFETSLLSLECFHKTGKVFIGIEPDGDKVCISLLPDNRFLFRRNLDAIELRDELERILREIGANDDFPPEATRRKLS